MTLTAAPAVGLTVAGRPPSAPASIPLPGAAVEGSCSHQASLRRGRP